MCGGEDVGRREHQEANATLGKQSKRLGKGLLLAILVLCSHEIEK